MTEPAFVFESDAVGVDRTERERYRSVRALAASAGFFVLLFVLFVVAAVANLGDAVGVPLFLACFVPPLAGFAALIAYLTAGWRGRPTLRPGSLEIDDRMLLVRGGSALRYVPLEHIAQGFWEEPGTLKLTTRDRETIVARAPDPAMAERVLRAAGVTAAERVLRVPLTSAAGQLFGARFLVGLMLATLVMSMLFGVIGIVAALVADFGTMGRDTLIGLGVLAAFIAMLGGLGYAAMGALRGREAVVGTDGITYAGSFRRRFVPYERIAQVMPDSRGVRLELTSGASLVLVTRKAGELALPMTLDASRSPQETRRRVLADRIQQAMAARGDSAPTRVGLERLDRNGRSVGEWREELSKLLGAPADYRHAPLSAEDLGHVIEDPAAPPGRRIGAAMALGGTDRDEARRRVEAAIHACADEGLRRDLERAAEGEIDDTGVESRRAKV